LRCVARAPMYHALQKLAGPIKLLHIKVDAAMLCAIAARIMRGSVGIEQHRLFAPRV
jgi:hypothetical protein